MTDLVVHPTLKFVYAGYTLTLVLVLPAMLFIWQASPTPAWLPLTLLALFFWPLSRQLRRLAVKLTIAPDKLRFETGMLSKSIRTIQLAKVQDVRVDQSLPQRILGVGTLSIETAGESSRLTVQDIDQPQALADEIMHRSELAGNGGQFKASPTNP